MDEVVTPRQEQRTPWWTLPERPATTERVSRPALSTPVFTAVAVLVGLAAGVICSLFRLALEQVERLRFDAMVAVVGSPIGIRIALGALVVAGCAGAAALAAWMVHRFAPEAEGSGIPRVEAVVDGRLKPAPPRVIPVKFAGGVVAIGSGLALGREGPSVQMGASVADTVARLFRLNLADGRMLMAAGAGAGLATAFNAPVAGAVFVLEELVRRFNARTTVATLGASASAIWISRYIVGDVPSFFVPQAPYKGTRSLIFFAVLGLVVGVAGIYYNRLILSTLDLSARFSQVSLPAKAAIVGALVGVIGVFAPQLLGGGGALAQAILNGDLTVPAIALALLVRWFLGPLSYAARTPGGIFAPLLLIGTQIGVLMAALGHWVSPDFAPGPVALGLTGMAAFFTASVRAPVTGIILVTEMTGSSTLLLPMLIACCVAMVIPVFANQDPIYESLARRTARPPKLHQVAGETR